MLLVEFPPMMHGHTKESCHLLFQIKNKFPDLGIRNNLAWLNPLGGGVPLAIDWIIDLRIGAKVEGSAR